MDLKTKVNQVLSDWNPIEVPVEITEAEYIEYVNPIIDRSSNWDDLRDYLKSLLVDIRAPTGMECFLTIK